MLKRVLNPLTYFKARSLETFLEWWPTILRSLQQKCRDSSGQVRAAVATTSSPAANNVNNADDDQNNDDTDDDDTDTDELVYE